MLRRACGRALASGHIGTAKRDSGQRPTAGGRSDLVVQHFMVPPRLTVFSQADVAEASAQGAVGRCPAALRALIPG
jgi:hypothetical protein